MPENYTFARQEARYLKDTVYEAILTAIEQGQLPPGTRLLETELAEEMGVSRGPVRHALKRLLEDGYIYHHPGEGLIITDLKSEEREKVFVPIRRIIECYAASCASKSFTDEDYDMAESLIADIAAACQKESVGELSTCDFKFHNFIVSKCASKLLVSIWESVAARVKLRIREWGTSLSDFNDVVAEHEEQLNAIRSGDEELICQVFSKYIY